MPAAAPVSPPTAPFPPLAGNPAPPDPLPPPVPPEPELLAPASDPDAPPEASAPPDGPEPDTPPAPFSLGLPAEAPPFGAPPPWLPPEDSAGAAGSFEPHATDATRATSPVADAQTKSRLSITQNDSTETRAQAARPTQVHRGGTNAASTERRAHEHARTSERDDDRARRTTRGAVMNGLDVVAVRIEQKRGVVAGMIRPLPGRTVVTSPGVEPGSVERVDGLSVRCLEREVNAPGELARRSLRLLAGNEELVCPKPVLALAAERDPQSTENGTIKTLARFDVPHDQLHVIQHSPAV